MHLTLVPPHIISVQEKSRSMLHHGSVGASLKQNKRNIKKPNPKNQKARLHHRILHIRISLSTKFQLKLLILIFSTKFAQKKRFPVVNQKSEQHH